MLKPLVKMWKYPRLVAWFATAVALQLAVRLAFSFVQIIPYQLEFNPGVVLVPLAGVVWGPAGVWGSLAASLIGDRLTGLWGPLSAFRAAGMFFFALSGKRLWEALSGRMGERSGHAPAWSPTLRFVLTAWPGCFVAAAWTALGTETLRLYPFPYVAGVVLVHHLLFVTVLGVALYRIAAREVVPVFGTWRDAMGTDAAEPISLRGVAALFIGAVGAWTGGVLAGGLAYRIWPLQPYVLGTSCGPLVEASAVPFLLLQAAAACWSSGAGRGRPARHG